CQAGCQQGGQAGNCRQTGSETGYGEEAGGEEGRSSQARGYGTGYSGCTRSGGDSGSGRDAYPGYAQQSVLIAANTQAPGSVPGVLRSGLRGCQEIERRRESVSGLFAARRATQKVWESLVSLCA